MYLTQKQKDFFTEIFGDKTRLPYVQGGMLKQQIDMSTAGRLDLNASGDFVFVDTESNGVIRVQFNSLAMPKMPVGPNTAISNFPFDRLHLSWGAQSGATCNLWYGYGATIIPTNQDILSIVNTVGTRNDGNEFNASYFSDTSIILGSYDQVVGSGANVAGVRITRARHQASRSETSGVICLCGNFYYEDVIAFCRHVGFFGGSFIYDYEIDQPVIMPATNAVQFYGDDSGFGSQDFRNICYTIL